MSMVRHNKRQERPAAVKRGKPTRKNDPIATKADILEVAQKEFADNGLSGARVDAIAAQTRTTKRAIYYYFGSKEGLYVAVLERVYQKICDVETSLHLEDLDPEAAIRRLAEFTFDYHEAHADFVRIVAIENIHNAQYLGLSQTIHKVNLSVIETIAAILRRGRNEGSLRKNVEAIDVHMLISALCFFRVSNRHTFRKIFRRDMLSPSLRPHHRRVIGDAVVRFVKA